MTLNERIRNDLKDAMQSRDKERIGALRLLASAIRYATEHSGELTPAAELSLLQREIRMRQDSIVQYRAAGREDLADATAIEMEIIESYMPELMSRDEIRAAVLAIIAEIGATGIVDVSKVTQRATAMIGGRADRAIMQRIVLEELNAKG